MTQSSHPSLGVVTPDSEPFVEHVEMNGHIIESLLLPKVLDQITALEGSFSIDQVTIGQRRNDPSHASLTVRASSRERLEEILTSIGQHGAVPRDPKDCVLRPCDIPGAFPEDFYCSTNQRTDIRLHGEWIAVEDQEMDCGVVVNQAAKSARCVPMSNVAVGDMVVIGRQGTRVHPEFHDTTKRDAFSFMDSTVSSEKPKGATVREIAAAMKAARRGEGKILVVAGPAVVHTGSRDDFSWLIEQGFVDVLFAGNALATHDIEQSFYGTSLGVSVHEGSAVEKGHEHHLRTINRIRRLGSIRQAVESGILTSGIMYQCVKRDIPFLLAGSIRDDGPLPDVVTDAIEAQRRMRELCRDVTFCLMIATTLHSIATGNLLPAAVKVVCVDINPATVTKLADRGTFQTVGLVTDVQPFLSILVEDLKSDK
ncbi:MAG: TIGR00300 family protein [Planctomycetaceae bacterium]|nr:TIGR00300 family protein [Planctomycetaceae bacterium]